MGIKEDLNEIRAEVDEVKRLQDNDNDHSIAWLIIKDLKRDKQILFTSNIILAVSLLVAILYIIFR